jgi:3-isopropylmalate/(R)-2-methylmalate dehydratase small subunit
MSEDSSIRKVSGTGIPLPGNDIDTDRIVPARYLKCVTFDGLGEAAFYDERFDEEGNPKDHPFNNPTYKGGRILITGSNFGCGSSREHAPQALLRRGIVVIVGVSFAEIFAGNCTALGVPTVCVSSEEAELLSHLVMEHPETVISVDLESQTLTAGDYHIKIDLPETSRRVLLEGVWDTTSVLLAAGDAIEETAQRLPYLSGFES